MDLLCAGLFNVLPGLALRAVGPWWVVPFILQFYLLWAFLGKAGDGAVSASPCLLPLLPLLPLLVLLVVGNVSPCLWPLSTVTATLDALIVCGQLRRLGAAPGWLAWVGALSLPIFKLNGLGQR